MNYRHRFHAGNFADVFKHALLLDLCRRLQKKEKGILYLDTHAGRGCYDLSTSAKGDTLERRPEHPEGWGRIEAAGEALPSALADYAAQVRAFRSRMGRATLYPGSPCLMQGLMRPQDRMYLCEKQPDEAAALAAEFARLRRVSVHATDGYRSVAAALPPPERRALVLIDPPYESTDEYRQIWAALQEGVRRLPGGTFVVWYPISQRAAPGEFLLAVAKERWAPTLLVEQTVADDASGLSLWGSGLLVLNPPWGVDGAWRAWLPVLQKLLAQGAGAGHSLRWLVPE